MAGWKLGYHTNCWGALGGNAVGVTSIKDLYYRTFGDMDRASADIADAGYQGIELFDGNLLDYRPDDFRALLRRHNLRLVAVYSGANFIYPDILDEELWRIARAAEAAEASGADHLVVGGGAQRAGDIAPGDYERLAEGLERVCDVADRHGLTPHFHPHLTTIVEASDQIDRVFGLSRINFCPDTAHLAAAGGDPAALIRTHADRLKYVHLKDFKSDPFTFLPLGEGELDMAGILRTLAGLAYEGWVTVELDAHDDPKAAAAVSARFLKAAMADLNIAQDAS